MRALVTGTSRLLGRALVARLRHDGWDTIATSRESRDGITALDVTDARAVSEHVARVDAVFHLAAVRERPMERLAEATRVNTLGAANVLASAASRGSDAPVVVLVGSAEEYGRATREVCREDAVCEPLSGYGASKLAATLLAQASAAVVPAVVLRPSVIYGAGQPSEQLMANAIRAVRTDGVCRLNGGDQTRDFVWVDDVAEALVLAAARARGVARGRVINVGSGLEVTVRAAAERVIELGNRGRIEIGPDPTRPGDIPRLRYDVTLARELLGWQARTSLDEGIRLLLAAD